MRRWAGGLAIGILCFGAARAAGADEPRNVIIVVGLPGAGKSTWAREIASALGASQPISSGDAIRAEVRARGLLYTPESERQVALEFEQRPGAIARALSDRIGALPGSVAVVEGLRSPHELDVLRADSRLRVTLVALEAPAEVRHARMLDRDRTRYTNLDSERHRADLRQRDADERRRGVDDLIVRADVRIDASGSPAATRARVREAGARLAARIPRPESFARARGAEGRSARGPSVRAGFRPAAR